MCRYFVLADRVCYANTRGPAAVNGSFPFVSRGCYAYTERGQHMRTPSGASIGSQQAVEPLVSRLPGGVHALCASMCSDIPSQFDRCGIVRRAPHTLPPLPGPNSLGPAVIPFELHGIDDRRCQAAIVLEPAGHDAGRNAESLYSAGRAATVQYPVACKRA